MRKYVFFLKRSIDLIGSGLGLIFLSPFLLIVAMAIKVNSPGPIFFKQDRLGKNGHVFKIYKFRTMIVDAEKIGSGLFVKTGKDNRITKVGNFLRATSLDELPQLINVLKGEMSLVGPRPPVPYHPYKYEEYSLEQRKRFEMRPGITGLTQVRVRNSVPWEKRIIVDVEYIDEFNLILDLKILVKTFQKMFKKDSIYTHSNS